MLMHTASPGIVSIRAQYQKICVQRGSTGTRWRERLSWFGAVAQSSGSASGGMICCVPESCEMNEHVVRCLARGTWNAFRARVNVDMGTLNDSERRSSRNHENEAISFCQTILPIR